MSQEFWKVVLVIVVVHAIALVGIGYKSYEYGKIVHAIETGNK